MTDKVLSHDIQQIIECRKANYVLPKELEKYCVNRYIREPSKCEFTFTKDIEKIAMSYANGINPNDVAIMNMIRSELNKINYSNYDERISIIKSLPFANELHFEKLAKDLIAQTMNDPTLIRNSVEAEATSPSVLYVRVVIDFSDFSIQCGDRLVKFKNVFLSKLLEKFREFTDKSLKLDTNNQHSVNIYKGFMNMMGLLYIHDYISDIVIFKCLDKVTNIIVNGNLPLLESDNYYTGYEKIITHTLNNASSKTKEECHSVYEQLLLYNKQIGQCNGLRKFSRETHYDNIDKLEKIMQAM